MADRRTRRSMKAIENAFLNLMVQKDISKITVAEIAELADLGRGTFYLHYQDVYDLYQKIGDAMIEEIISIFTETAMKEEFLSYRSMLESFFSYLGANQNKVKLYTRPDSSFNLNNKISSALMTLLTTKLPEAYTKHFDYTETLFMISGSLGVIENAIQSNADTNTITQDLNKILLMFEE